MANQSNVSPKAESVNGDTIEVKRDPSEDGGGDDEFSPTHLRLIKDEPLGSVTDSPHLLPQNAKTSRSSSSSTVKSRATSTSSLDKKEAVDNIDENSAKMEPFHPSKPSRSASQKAAARTAPLFDHLEDVTMEAKRSFAVLDSCTYANKYLGYTEHAMECDCNEEWDSTSRQNNACGDDSDCINRATKMECVGDCGCGSACQNQRFQQQQYANVSVIKTEKKGYGLRTNTDLRSGDFIFEYIGEVINEAQFRRRMVQYDEEGIKHFYFMSLSKGEFVDATKKGNLGRFCNHSCSPNCYVDKWVVGDKLRMGIFAEKKVKAGEELVFNYNVDRYGANPQPCYCGEPNCTGFIGGKTQTERATKLSAATIEALGIDDGDSWDTTVAKRPRKKKTGEDDGDYVESVEAKSLDTEGVTKVMAALMQCKEMWIAVKLLQRIQNCDDESVRSRVVKMHGYQILNSQLTAWKEDVNIVLQILDILAKFPRLTRNKIVDSKIESTLQQFTTNEDERVSSQAITLLDHWSKLEVAYRIPRKKRDANESATLPKQESRYERRESAHERKRSRSRSRSRTPPRGPSTSSAPSGPRSSLPQRNNNFYPQRPPPFHRPVGVLPRGWFQALDNGKIYYYSADGQTTWVRPSQPAVQPPPPPKQPSNQDMLKSIIDNIVSAKEKERDVRNATPNTPQAPLKDKKDKKEEKWRSYDEGKKKKLYENTLFPHISHVMNKYKNKIPRDDLKRFAKEIAKKLVESDFKGGRVDDPTRISDKHQQKVKKYCKDFFEKAAYKHSKHEKEKLAKRAKPVNEAKANGAGTLTETSTAPSPTPNLDASPDLDIKIGPESDEEDVKMSEDEPDEEEKRTPKSPSIDFANGDNLKRKRSQSEDRDVKDEDDLTKSPLKKLNLDSPPPPPPPPPAPPVETPPDGTPGQSDDASLVEVDMELHAADTAFKSKSMADVLASAQQDTGDDDVDADVRMEDRDGNCSLEENGLSKEKTGLLLVGRDGDREMLQGNPLVDGQVGVE